MHQSLSHKWWLGIAALIAFDLLLWQAIVARQTHASDAALYFLDVGQGDSQLISLPGDVQILIDGGPPNGKVLDALARVLPPGDRYVDVLIMTHPQTDHFGGFADVFERYEVGALIGSGRDATLAGYRDLEHRRNTHKVPYVTVEAGDMIRYGDAVLSILNPTPRFLSDKEVNESSVVTRLDYGAMSALYTGDIGAPVEQALSKNPAVDVDVLKVPHHGSRFSSSAGFLAAVSPKAAVIGVGKNSYGHPTPAALGRLEKAGAQIFRTDTDGTIRINLSEGNLLIYKEKK